MFQKMDSNRNGVFSVGAEEPSGTSKTGPEKCPAVQSFGNKMPLLTNKPMLGKLTSRTASQAPQEPPDPSPAHTSTPALHRRCLGRHTPATAPTFLLGMFNKEESCENPPVTPLVGGGPLVRFLPQKIR